MSINRREFVQSLLAVGFGGMKVEGKETDHQSVLENGLDHLKSQVLQDTYESSCFSSFGKDGVVKWNEGQEGPGNNVSTSVYNLRKVVQKAEANGDQLLVFWHTHPQKVFNKVFRQKTSGPLLNKTSFPPSVGFGHKGHDLGAFMQLQSLVRENKNKHNLKLQCCVADALGVWRVVINNQNEFAAKFQQLLENAITEEERKKVFDNFFTLKENRELVKRAQQASEDYTFSSHGNKELQKLKNAYGALGLDLEFMDYKSAARMDNWEVAA